ncbi:hypothetical protein AN219_26685, partial [Streptomyces nanshensis]
FWATREGGYEQADEAESARRIASMVQQAGLPPRTPLVLMNCYGSRARGLGRGHTPESPSVRGARRARFDAL